MKTRLFVLQSLILFLIVAVVPARISVSCADMVYVLGNSLAYDTQPEFLDGTVHFSIHCNQNLQQIFDDPNGSCLGSHSWNTALAQNSYDWVVVQPFYGTSMLQDASIIQQWMSLQPNAQFVIHTGWPQHSIFSDEYYGNFNDGMMRSNPGYFSSLISEIETQTGRQVLNNHAVDVFATIYEDILAGRGPYDELSDLYRDNIHAGWNDGRYLAHNIMRYRLGMPFSVGYWGSGPNLVPPENRDYLNGAILRTYGAIPESSSGIVLLVLANFFLLTYRR